MTEEDVIKRKLLIDGDGTGDDRRLTLLLKAFTKWSNSYGESSTEIKTVEEQLFEQLHQCEYIYEKTRIASKMNVQEQENYRKLASNIKKEIERTKDEIQSAKEKLQEAKIFRKNRMEYEVIANVIDQHPERKDTHQKLTAIKKELGNLEEVKQMLDNKLEMRRKHFHVLVASLYQLQAILDNEELNEESSHVNISDDEMDTFE